MFSYLGGKKFQAKWIGSHFPVLKKYVEPFGGAFWVYFQNGIEFDKNVYNDYNRFLTNIFYCARNKQKEFVKELLKYEPQKREAAPLSTTLVVYHNIHSILILHTYRLHTRSITLSLLPLCLVFFSNFLIRGILSFTNYQVHK